MKEVIDLLKRYTNGKKNTDKVEISVLQLNRVIKALEQDSILDKIRAEIADLDDADYDYEGYYKAVTDALQIIDKYKAEREE